MDTHTNKQAAPHPFASSEHINTLDQSQIFIDIPLEQNVFLIKRNLVSLSHPEVILEALVEKRHKISCLHGE